MGRYLLDANVLIAMAVTEHVNHSRAVSWAAQSDVLGLCPISEGALVRFLVRAGESVSTASNLLGAFHASGRFEFWPDDVSYRDTDLSHVVGHRQVTDAYLAALAVANHARVATFDQALARTLPGQVTLVQ